MLQSFVDEFRRYRLVAERAMGQLDEGALNRIVAPNGNSVAMIVRHISGNLVSRFTDFLESDGEKPWRDRDAEFETREYGRAEMEELWRRGWSVLEAQLASLSDEDLSRTVTIRGQPLTVHDALARSAAHAAYHAGQIVLLARMLAAAEWKWITIPKGESEEYNRAPTHEKSPR